MGHQYELTFRLRQYFTFVLRAYWELVMLFDIVQEKLKPKLIMNYLPPVVGEGMGGEKNTTPAMLALYCKR